MPDYNPTDIPLCPHCSKPMEAKAESYTLNGRYGSFWKQKDNCWECGEEFIAYRKGDDTISIERSSHAWGF